MCIFRLQTLNCLLEVWRMRAETSYLHAISNGPIRNCCHVNNYICSVSSSFPSDFASLLPASWIADILKYTEFCMSEVLSNLTCYKALSKLTCCKALRTLPCYKILSTLTSHKILNTQACYKIQNTLTYYKIQSTLTCYKILVKTSLP
jgi:hypothetical protein